MKKTIYLDHSATTPVDERVKKEMGLYFCEIYGNPSSLHHKGSEVKEAINKKKKKISNIISSEPEEIIFTGSGTESINLAIKGVSRANKNKGKHIITCKIEHHAVLDTCSYLEKEEGFNITYLGVNEYGFSDLEELKKAIQQDTILITISYANNEIGTIQQIKEIAKIAKEKSILFHTDACQAAGFLDINVKNLGVSLMTLNGSKIYAPKGIGILYVKKGVLINSLIQGGGQERGLRSGTENVPFIVAISKALEMVQKEKDKENKRLILLRDYFISEITKKIPDVILNGHPKQRLPNNINVSFLGVEGESILLHLDNYGICASTGSACTSNSLEPSHVLVATNTPVELSHSSIRFSLGRKTTKEEIDYVISILPEIIFSLRKISPIHGGRKK